MPRGYYPSRDTLFSRCTVFCCSYALSSLPTLEYVMLQSASYSCGPKPVEAPLWQQSLPRPVLNGSSLSRCQ
jgi:hypothetical protein